MIGGRVSSDYTLTPRLKKNEYDFLQLAVVWFGWIEKREYSVASGELGGRHVSTAEEVFLFYLVEIEENRETLAVEKNDDVWVTRNERTRWHVGSVYGGLVLLNTRLEVTVSSLIVKAVETVL